MNLDETRLTAPTARRMSFHDLRTLAQSLPSGRSTAGVSGNAYTDSRCYVDLTLSQVEVGFISLGPSAGHVADLGGDEFIVLLAGDLEIEAGDRRLVLTAGQSAVIPGGAAFDWRAAQDTSLLFMTHAGPTSPIAAPLTIDETAELSPSNPPLAELLVGPTPQCRNHTQFRSDDGAFTCGVWSSTPYHRMPMTYGHYELMHLLAGAVTLEDESGRRATFTTGDVVLVERGANCSWLSEVDVVKVFAIYRPAQVVSAQRSAEKALGA